MSVIVSLAFWTSSGLSGSNRNSKSPYPVFSMSIPGKGLLLFSMVFSMVLSCACGGSIRPRRFRVHRAGEGLQSQQSTAESDHANQEWSTSPADGVCNVNLLIQRRPFDAVQPDQRT